VRQGRAGAVEGGPEEHKFGLCTPFVREAIQFCRFCFSHVSQVEALLAPLRD